MPSHRQCTLSSSEVHACAQQWLQPLKIKERPSPWGTSVIVRILFLAAARMSSIGGICRDLSTGPSDQTVYDALADTLGQDIDRVQRRLNACLRHQLPKKLLRRQRTVALDWTLIPYHGLPFEDERELFRSRAQSGTTTFHAYATAFVCENGYRYTLAIKRVEGGTSMKEIVQDLVRQMRHLGLKIKVLLLDRGFYSVAVMKYLRRTKCPFVMPAVIRGRRPGPSHQPRGMRALRERRVGWYRTTVRSQDDAIDIDVCVACKRFRVRKTGQIRVKKLLYVAWGYRASPLEIRELYRKRFAIETSYRQMNQARIRSSTRHPLERLVYFAIALILRNVWVWLHFTLFATKKRGRPKLRLHLLRFRRFLNWLAQQTELNLHGTTPYKIEWTT